MKWLTSEILFYGGIGISAGAVVLGSLFFAFLQMKKFRLKNELDREYGEIVKKRRK